MPLLPTIRRSFISKWLQPLCLRRFQHSTFEAGDFCLLRELKSNRKYLIGPLEDGQKRDHRGGMLYHADLIGKPVRSVVQTHNGAYSFMLHKPTLDEYVVNVPRNCTPIYPKDASAIVQMLDIEPGHRILEAGTGNGSLTLYLARAVSSTGTVDTYEVREDHSRLAQKHVKRYARGRYQDIVNFHIGPLSDLQAPEGTYDGIVLDMPEPETQLDKVVPALRNDRGIVCYLPNMTQVLNMAQAIRHLPLFMESCVETEWREWEVRATQIRSKENETAWVCRPKNYDVKGHTAFLVLLRKCVNDV